MEKERLKTVVLKSAKENPEGIVVSIPSAAGILFGDVLAMQFVEVAKKRCREEKFPMGVFGSGCYFCYGNGDRLIADVEYLEEFIAKSMKFGDVIDIVNFS